MENEKMLITLERYDQLIAERAVYKNEAQRLEDENIELKAQIKDLEEENNKIPSIHFNTPKTTDEEEVLIVDDTI
ncbi:TPA: hypothetical protein K8054_000258 [Staphylococcus pseudintermedius]|uniref:Uncharacterized protein n=8 Tax=root TaxID=1 RepID=A0A499SHT2_9CAUD|nr:MULTISPECIES: hypothetical protein [Staphylococcus intermedius group]YP_010081573.1 hypothetical protein KMD08_gp19 [Staphylococcus phage phiSP44-1]YP_010081913.1 hypothetical protein KMD13_gp14 [Staphylococcus phage SpT152]ASU01220.1 hypothetical protein [Staphylococcus phage SN13]ASU01289.1 hypothetical protein [Staphylococcus phage SN11]AZB66559.1 hypothetical protein [Staphylococcus phage phiSP38-1]ANQ81043.1 hypothetical protein A9I66_02715 [Staphylococcus pseudintermedius]ANQ82470.1